ncbi:DUF6119 family protein [Plantactinospora soyae]|uniref:Uncharacterized protein (TIGR04141 family) n=1 Tax=Plantactinospora soyae TaxID=1544732 RepID=A0A927M9E4_9ACTN|nr:DUF6119 family protein [Plantactinospora soyae]MBE1489006.1 uncharacterized protein (TIGR04141 family) [Plantactinospora soyae]
MQSARHRPRTRPPNRPAARKDARRPPNEQPALFDLAVPEQPTGTYQTSVYQLDRVPSTIDGLQEGLNHRYVRENQFVPEPRLVAGKPALLVRGTVPRERADWCDVLTSLTDGPVELGFSSGGAVLLVAVDDQVYALTYGTLGRFMIDLERVNPGFGIGFAVRSLAPDAIKQVRRRVFGTSGRVDRNLVPGGTHIRMYGIDKWGEIVGQISGKAHNSNLTACRSTGRPTPVEGSNALRIHLATEPEQLLADLREIDRVCRTEAPHTDLEFITQIRPVESHDPRLPELEDQLDERLGLADPPDVGLAVPDRLAGDFALMKSYEIYVPRSATRRSHHRSDLSLADILTRTNQVPAGKRWKSLGSGSSLTAYADEAASEEIGEAPVSRWITAQLASGESQLLLHDGRWFEVGDKHREFLRDEIVQILARPTSLVLPPWRHGEDEASYNRKAERSGAGLVLLDRKLLTTAQHHRGIEACDLLGSNGELIHVKRVDRSAPLSHLFAQGMISMDALKYEADARKALVEMVRRQNPGRRIDLDFRPRKVVYAIALSSGKALTVSSLFTFAQVALYRAVKALRNEDVDVEVIGIPYI